MKKLKSRIEIECKLLELYKLERTTGNSQLKESRMSPRRQGKIRSLRWVLGQTDNLK